MKQSTKVFGRVLGDAVDVPGNRSDTLIDPGGGLARRGLERVAEGARRAGEDEGADTRPRRFLKQDQRAKDVRRHEFFARMRRDMRFMQCRGMKDGVREAHDARGAGPVDDRADLVRERTGKDVEPDRLLAFLAERAHQRFAQMPGAPRHEKGHWREGSPCRRARAFAPASPYHAHPILDRMFNLQYDAYRLANETRQRLAKDRY